MKLSEYNKKFNADCGENIDKDGYYVIDTNNNEEGWISKEVFDKSCLLQGEDPTRINLEMINDMQSDNTETTRMRNHTVVCKTLSSGFSIVIDSACVDSENYDEEIGRNIALSRVHSKIWEHLGFVLAWSKNGLKGT